MFFFLVFFSLHKSVYILVYIVVSKWEDFGLEAVVCVIFLKRNGTKTTKTVSDSIMVGYGIVTSPFLSSLVFSPHRKKNEP